MKLEVLQPRGAATEAGPPAVNEPVSLVSHATKTVPPKAQASDLAELVAESVTRGGFRGEYDFCSNFHLKEVHYQGLTFQCSEAAFQAAKFQDPAFRARFCNLEGPGAKRLGATQHPSFRKDWDEARIGVMREVLRAKFSDPQLREALLATGTTQLVEFNTWGDSYWGVARGRGENHLGLLLMELRDALQAEATGPSRDRRIGPVYHGTNAQFDEFEVGHSRTAEDFYFADTPETAAGFGKNVLACYIRAERLFNMADLDDMGPEERGVLQQVFEDIGADYGFEDLTAFMDVVTNGDMYQMFANSSFQDEVLREINDKGYDAVYMVDAGFCGFRSKSYVVFDPGLVEVIGQPAQAAALSMTQGARQAFPEASVDPDERPWVPRVYLDFPVGSRITEAMLDEHLALAANGWQVQHFRPGKGGLEVTLEKESAYQPVRDRPSVLYHLTSMGNCQAILAEGLRPKGNPEGDRMRYSPRSFLLSSADPAQFDRLAQCLLPERTQEGVYAVLEVSVRGGAPIYEDPDFDEIGYWTRAPIPPSSIRLLESRTLGEFIPRPE